MLRASAGTVAVVRGGMAGKGTCVGGAAAGVPGTLPTTAYFLVGERCAGDCAFCPQARSSSARGDLLSRVNWPAVAEEDEDFWAGLGRALESGRLRRVCLQLTRTEEALEVAQRLVRSVRGLWAEVPICVSVAARGVGEVGRVLGWGVDRVTVALDAASTAVHREVKGGDLAERLELLREAARRWPGRVGTHLIVGLGETEEEVVRLVGELEALGVTVGLFAFTPVPGTRLGRREPPPLEAYRRVQAARHLIVTGRADAAAMSFDPVSGRLTGYGLEWERTRDLLRDGEAFRTSGCPDCNRPYYNERPSGPLYNYPRPLTPAEAEAAVREARPWGAVWRLLVEPEPHPAAWNMAVDEAVLEAHARGLVPPTLRFYRWSPAAVSLGYFQDAEREVDRAALSRLGLDLVRRVTGGRAVLHDREVTYAVVVSQGLLPGSVVETYRRLAEGLVEGLRRLGVPADLAPERAGSGGPGDPYGACFEVPSSYEIVCGGRKVVGSAQVRRKGVILQHGSIPLVLDERLLAEALGLGPGAAERIAARATGLAETLGGQVPEFEEVCRAVADGLGHALGVDFEPGGLLTEETAAAERLVAEKYGRAEWNLARPQVREEA